MNLNEYTRYELKLTIADNEGWDYDVRIVEAYHNKDTDHVLFDFVDYRWSFDDIKNGGVILAPFKASDVINWLKDVIRENTGREYPLYFVNSCIYHEEGFVLKLRVILKFN